MYDEYSHIRQTHKQKYKKSSLDNYIFVLSLSNSLEELQKEDLIDIFYFKFVVLSGVMGDAGPLPPYLPQDTEQIHLAAPMFR